MSAQPVSLENVDDVYAFCHAALKRKPAGTHIPPDEYEDELAYAIEHLYVIRSKWDPTRTTGTFADHAWYQMTRYYVAGDIWRRREREARETPAWEDDVASVDTADAAAQRSFWEDDQRIFAEQVERLMAERELSELDRQIVRGRLDDVSNAQLARELAVSDSTIDAHLVRLQPAFREFLGFR